MVLVGDPRQLPATVLSPRAERAGLGRSLFERLEGAGHEVVMLTVQYRMHPGTLRFISHTRASEERYRMNFSVMKYFLIVYYSIKLILIQLIIYTVLNKIYRNSTISV